MTETTATPERSYGCSRGCGNPFDFVFTSVSEAFTELLCLPCFVSTAVGMIQAVTEPDNETVQRAVAEFPPSEQTPMSAGVTRKRGHHAPAEVDDPDALEAFDGVVTVDELPDAFR